MARRTLTRSLYDTLLRAFRTHGTNITHVCNAARVGRDFAQRGWERGWLEQHDWARPIKDVLDEEHVEARALMSREPDALPKRLSDIADDARIDAIVQVAHEAMGVRYAVYATASIMKFVASTSRDLPTIAEAVSAELAEAVRSKTMKLGDAVDLVNSLARISAMSVASYEKALMLEREHLRLPPGLSGMSTRPVEELEEDAEAAWQTIQIARERRLRKLAKLEGVTVTVGVDGDGS